MHLLKTLTGFPRTSAVASGCLFITILTGGCSRSSPDVATTAPLFWRDGNRVVVPEGSSLKTKLAFESVQETEVHQARRFTGRIQTDPERFARVFAPLPGKVIKLHVTVGDKVAEGDAIATLHAPDFIVTQGDFLKARSALNVASRNLKRQQDLRTHKVAAERDVEQAESEMESAQADFKASRDRLTLMSFDPDKDEFGAPLVVRSPQSGKVVEVAAAKGENRNDNTAEIAVVADLSVVWLSVDVPEKDLRFLQPAQEIEAQLASYPGEMFRGKVVSVGDILSPETRMVTVRVELPNAEARLKPGMFATVSVLGLPERQLTVPASALVQVGSDTFIYEQIAPGTLEARTVTLGGDAGNGRLIVASGLKSGAVVLTQQGVLIQ